MKNHPLVKAGPGDGFSGIWKIQRQQAVNTGCIAVQSRRQFPGPVDE